MTHGNYTKQELLGPSESLRRLAIHLIQHVGYLYSSIQYSFYHISHFGQSTKPQSSLPRLCKMILCPRCLSIAYE
jgi:hypothetical protein